MPPTQLQKLSFPKNLGTRRIVRAHFKEAPPTAFRAAGGASLKKRELSCVHTSSLSKVMFNTHQ